jgi:peptide deformylase
MGIRNIVKRGDELLAKKSRPVEKFDRRFQILIDDMIDTMRKSEGVGIAAPQVGILRRAVVIKPGEDAPEMVLVNPEIVAQSGSVEGTEGCLSVPEIWGIVPRPEKIEVKAQDRHGNPLHFHAEGYTARVICHEVDHLEGILFTERAVRFVDPDEDED